MKKTHVSPTTCSLHPVPRRLDVLSACFLLMRFLLSCNDEVPPQKGRHGGQKGDQKGDAVGGSEQEAQALHRAKDRAAYQPEDQDENQKLINSLVRARVPKPQ